MRLGISGHQDLSPAIITFVRPAMVKIISDQKDRIVGVSSLAVGADQLFAWIVLEHGGALHAIIPCDGYERTFAEPERLKDFQSLLARAAKRETLSYPEPSEEAFLAAGHRVVDNSDVLIAVWDGRPAGGKGGTADIVDYARGQNREVRVVWPPGVAR